MGCYYCFTPFEPKILEESDVEEGILSALAAGAGEISFSGGEPTLHRDLVRLVERAKEAGAVTVGLQTNGLKLSDRTYCRKLAAAGLSYVEISIPSHRQRLFDEIARAPGAFNRVMKGMGNLSDLEIPLSVNHVICTKNHRYTASFAKFMIRRFRLDVLTLLMATPTYAELAHPGIIVRYSDAAPFIMKALDLCIESGQRFEGLWEKCGVPLCVLGGNRAYFPRARLIPEEDRSRDFTDVSACGTCAVRDRCFRVRKLYIKLYGTAEFRPVRKKGGLGSVRSARQDEK
jgi:hypothetical protein